MKGCGCRGIEGNTYFYVYNRNLPAVLLVAAGFRLVHTLQHQTQQFPLSALEARLCGCSRLVPVFQRPLSTAAAYRRGCVHCLRSSSDFSRVPAGATLSRLCRRDIPPNGVLCSDNRRLRASHVDCVGDCVKCVSTGSARAGPAAAHAHVSGLHSLSAEESKVRSRARHALYSSDC